MIDPLWNLNGVVLAGRHRPRLVEVTLTISAGVTAVLGPSGAGKSSLLNLLVGFEKPDAGRVERCFAPADGQLSLFWGPPNDGLWPHLTVGEHLRGVVPAGGQVEELLRAFDLSDKIDARPDQLSQGESARLAVARALAADPCVLVLDEPLAHVDPARVWKYWDVLQTKRQPGRRSIVFSTHSPEVVLREADQVICLNEGRVMYSGSVQELYARPPTAQLGWSLGPVNWFAPSEGRTWLDQPLPEERGYRPEQLVVSPSAESPLVVQQSRASGSVAELDLLDERSGARRRFFHRPQSHVWQAGERVRLRLLALLLLCVFVAGCSASSAAHQLPVKQIESWSMPAEGPSIPAPRAVHATQEGEIYVLDNAGRVLVFDDRGKLQRKWWMPEYSVGKPEKICKLRDGRLAVADTHYHQVVIFDDQGVVVNKWGSLGHEPGQFIYPVAVVEDDDENLYVCEYGDNDRIQKFDKQGQFLLQFGSQGVEPGQFTRPSGIVWDQGLVYVVDAFNNRIQVFTDTGEFQQLLGGEEAELYYPYDIALSPAGELYVVEYGAGRVSKFNKQGKLLGRFGSSGSGQNQFSTPWGLTVDSKSRVYVADTGNRCVVQLQF